MFRRDFKGTLFQLFPLSANTVKELTGAGNIDCRKKKVIVFFDPADITIDGSVEISVSAGSCWALTCETISVASAVKYGIA